MSDIEVEVVYALPDEPFVAELRLPAGSTAGEAIQRSGVFDRFPMLRAASAPIGIFGRRCEAETALANGDRVEIYRPLNDDVKARRRERVAAIRRKRQGRAEE